MKTFIWCFELENSGTSFGVASLKELACLLAEYAGDTARECGKPLPVAVAEAINSGDSNLILTAVRAWLDDIPIRQSFPFRSPDAAQPGEDDVLRWEEISAPRVIIHLESSLVNEVFADSPIRYAVVDHDTEGAQDDELIDYLDGEEVANGWIHEAEKGHEEPGGFDQAWAHLEARTHEEREPCDTCGSMKPKSQVNQTDGDGNTVCNDCAESQEEDKEPETPEAVPAGLAGLIPDHAFTPTEQKLSAGLSEKMTFAPHVETLLASAVSTLLNTRQFSGNERQALKDWEAENRELAPSERLAVAARVAAQWEASRQEAQA